MLPNKEPFSQMHAPLETTLTRRSALRTEIDAFFAERFSTDDTQVLDVSLGTYAIDLDLAPIELVVKVASMPSNRHVSILTLP